LLGIRAYSLDVDANITAEFLQDFAKVDAEIR